MSISISLLNSLPFFEGLDDSQRNELCNIATLRSFKPGAVICHAGEVQEAIGYVVSGQLQTKELADDGRVVAISVSGAGHWVGWLSLVDNSFLGEEVTCLSNCQLITFTTRLLRPIVQSNPTLSNRLLQLAALAIKTARQQRAMLTLPHAFQRICFQISQLSGEFDPKTLEPISALPRQQELATAANTSRETVSRTLRLLIKAGIIKKAGHRVIVRRLDLLKRVVYEGPEELESRIAETHAKSERSKES